VNKTNNIPKRSLMLLAFGSLIGLAPVAKAQLINLTIGDYTINANGYTSDELTGIDANFAKGGLVVPGSGGHREDTWGIFQVTSILSGASTVFADNAGTEYWGVLYNSYDVASGSHVDLAGHTIFDFASVGLQLDIYKVTISDLPADSKFQNVYLQGTAGRGATADAFKGISVSDAGINGGVAGSLVLSSKLSGQSTSSFNTFNKISHADGILDITFNNLFALPPGTALGPMTYGLAGSGVAPPADWNLKFDGPAIGEVVPVPEPSTYGLIGAVGLIGIAALRRRSSRAIAA